MGSIAVVDHGEHIERIEQCVHAARKHDAPPQVLHVSRVAHLCRAIGASTGITGAFGAHDRNVDLAGLEVRRSQCHRQVEERRNPDPVIVPLEPLNVDRAGLALFEILP